MKLPIPEAVLQTHTIVFGMTGSGKSSVMRLLVEYLLDDAKAHPLLDSVPITIIDPKGDHWGLRSSADGKGKGYPMVIFGGDHGDLPLAVEAGAAVADAVLSGAYTSLVDMSLLTLGERTRFFTDFATAYYRARTPRRLVIDEVHNFCPKGKVPDPQVGKMLHISNTIASEGRGRGITMVAASQRPQKVHNDFSSSCATLIAMKVMHPADRAAYKDWLDGTGDKVAASEILSSAAALAKGTGWVWCVGEEPFGPTKVAFPKYKTYDSFKPQSASAVVTGKALPDLDKLREQMSAYLEQRKLNDPAELKKTIRALEDALRKSQSAHGQEVLHQGPTPEQHRSIVEQERELLRAEFNTELQSAVSRATREVAENLLTPVRKSVALLMNELDRLNGSIHEPILQHTPIAYMAPTKKPAPRPNNPLIPAAKMFDGAGDDNGLTKGQQKILDALLWLSEAGYNAPSREQLSAIASYRGGAFGRAMGGLKTRGLIVYAPGGGAASLTAPGAQLAVPDTSAMTMTQRWRAALKKDGHRKIFDGLLDGGMTRDELSKKIGYSGGAYGRAIGELFTMGVLVYPEPGSVRLSENVLG